jgi:DNA-binding winged helix-turn-helix (wHTH) protein
MASVAIPAITELRTRRDIVLGEIEIDLDRLELRRNGRHVAVQPLIFELLVYFVRHRGRLVTKDELIREVWRGTIVADGAITQAVSVLRKAIGDRGRSPRLIKTVHKFGYILSTPATTTIALRGMTIDARRATA